MITLDLIIEVSLFETKKNFFHLTQQDPIEIFLPLQPAAALLHLPTSLFYLECHWKKLNQKDNSSYVGLWMGNFSFGRQENCKKRDFNAISSLEFEAASAQQNKTKF